MRTILLALLLTATAAAAEPPAGFTPLFNGKDFTGWRGRPHFDPAKEAEGDERPVRVNLFEAGPPGP